MTSLKELNKINLQLFAEGGADDDSTSVDDTTQTSTDSKTYTEEELQKLIQQEADRRVSSALSKKEKEYKQILENEQKKANMTQEELAKEKEKELAERENQLKEYELKLAKLDYFKTKGYDIELLDYVIGSDEDEIKANSDALVEIVNKTVEKVVSERLKEKSSTPPKSKESEKLSITDLADMSPEEINKVWKNLK